MKFNLPDLKMRYGKETWAVVTGASDGIGAEYCFYLAKQGFNLVLISRTKSKLEAVKRQALEMNNKIKVKLIVSDFNGNARMDYY